MENEYLQGRFELRKLGGDYRTNKRNLDKIQERFPDLDLSDIDVLDEAESEIDETMLLRFTKAKDDVEKFDSSMDRVRDEYGEDAEAIMRDCFMNSLTQKQLAEKYSYSERTFKRRFMEWMKTALRK